MREQISSNLMALINHPLVSGSAMQTEGVGLRGLKVLRGPRRERRARVFNLQKLADSLVWSG